MLAALKKKSSIRVMGTTCEDTTCSAVLTSDDRRDLALLSGDINLTITNAWVWTRIQARKAKEKLEAWGMAAAGALTAAGGAIAPRTGPCAHGAISGSVAGVLTAVSDLAAGCKTDSVCDHVIKLGTGAVLVRWEEDGGHASIFSVCQGLTSWFYEKLLKDAGVTTFIDQSAKITSLTAVQKDDEKDEADVSRYT